MKRTALTGLVLILIAAAGLPSAAAPPGLEEVSAAATCAAELAGSLELPALPPELGGQHPIFAACDTVCRASCYESYNSCLALCQGRPPGDPCYTECRSIRIACVQGCGCIF